MHKYLDPGFWSILIIVMGSTFHSTRLKKLKEVQLFFKVKIYRSYKM